MSVERKIYIFRHGETDWNREGRFQGHIDVPLNLNGREQARELVPKLIQAEVRAIFSSDLCRAYETARIVANRLAIPVFTDAGLREANIGEAQGLLKEEIEEKFGLELASRWRSSAPTDADVSYPGGESGESIMNRVFRAAEDFLDRTDYPVVALSAHGGVIRRVMEKILPAGSAMVPIPNGVLYELHFQKRNRKWTAPLKN